MHLFISCVQGLWRGTLAGQLLYVPYAAIQFATLQQCNAAAARLQLRDSRAAALVPYAAGAAAGAAATCASYPFDLLRTTLAAQGEPRVRPLPHRGSPSPSLPSLHTLGLCWRGILL